MSLFYLKSCTPVKGTPLEMWKYSFFYSHWWCENPLACSEITSKYHKRSRRNPANVGVYISRPHAAGILLPPPFYTPPTSRRVFWGVGGVCKIWPRKVSACISILTSRDAKPFELSLRFGLRCERSRCQIATNVCRAMRTTKLSAFLQRQEKTKTIW